MVLDLPITLALLAVAVALLGFAHWRARQPAQALKVRMLNYNILQIFALLFVLLMLAHVVSLVTGHQMVGRRRF